MKIMDLEQNGPGWHAWRAGGIGSSDAPVIMEEATWTSIEELAELKAGRGTPIVENEDMARGKRLEPFARAAYMDVTGIRVRPVCVVNDRIPWLRSSLDGLSEDGKIILEIKCPRNPKKHADALKGKYPGYYKAQLYHHLLAANGAEVVHFWSWTDDEKSFPDPVSRYKLIEVFPDYAYMTKLLEREAQFVEWQRRQNDRIP